MLKERIPTKKELTSPKREGKFKKKK